MSVKELESVLIVGGGVSGFSTALALKCVYPNLDITIISSEQFDEDSAMSEACLPSIHAFHKKIGLTEKELIQNTETTFSLATRYKNFGFSTQDYFMPFNDHGFTIHNIEFPQIVAFLKLQGHELKFDDFSLNSVAARMERFAKPGNKAGSVFSTLSYAYQLDIPGYETLLQNKVANLSIRLEQVQSFNSNESRLNKEGSIEALSFESIKGDTLTFCADLYIDCTAQGEIIRGLLEEELSSNKCSALCNVRKSRSLRHNLPQRVKPYVELSSEDAQLTRTFTLRSSIIQETYQTQECEREQESDLSYDSKTIYERGVLKQAWVKNLIAMGGACGFFDTFYIGRLHCLHTALFRVLELFPKNTNYSSVAVEYNRMYQNELENILDFHTLHYVLKQYWQSAGEKTRLPNIQANNIGAFSAATDLSLSIWGEYGSKLQLPESLVYKILLFQHRGLIPEYENETLSSGLWSSFFYANDIWPVHANAMLDETDVDWAAQNITKMQTLIKQAASSLSPFAQVLGAVS